ncbi:MAG: Uma2 family endonuclease [Clostridiales bacterium]|jgi:Uma2 family endonuclease|nr:Uma2 family endonuclease [Clostridiales bacterium]
MSEILSRDQYSDPPKQEKINGVLYNMAAGTAKHAEAVSNIFAVLARFFTGKRCKPFSSELEVHLDSDNVFRPDVSVVCDFSIMKDNGYYGAPSLVAEILSPSTARRDRAEKYDLYERNGVKEYLLINPEYLSVEQYALIDGEFKLQAIYFRPGTEFKSYAFDDLLFNLDEIFDYRQ